MATSKSYSYIFHCLLLVLCTVMLSPEAYAAKRVALVIGNSGYSNSPLKNPRNDARDMAETLKEIGFEVILETDVSKRQIEEAMNTFYRKLQKAEVGFFFYAGHGMQIDGMNYLIPLGAHVANASDIKYEAVPAGRILGKMKDAGNKLNIVVLDACRDNPFRSYFRSGNKGLAFMDAPDGTFIAYATAIGSVAADGKGRNGLYTGKLLVNLRRPDLTIYQVFNQTGLDVQKMTAGKQIPWVLSSPMESFYLAGGSSVAEVVELEPETQQNIGSLQIESTPGGASVFIDGNTAGKTPVELGEMPPGKKRLQVEKSGYISEEKSVLVRAGKRKVVRFDLVQEQTKGWLTILPTPSNARIRILNISPRYSKGMELLSGKYHLEVSADDYQTKQQWITLGAGDDLDVNITLQRKQTHPTASTPKSRSHSSSPKQNFTDSATGTDFIWIKGGCYQMGDIFGDGNFNEKPVHEVCVDSFYMSKYEVTVAQWRRFVQAVGYQTDAEKNLTTKGCRSYKGRKAVYIAEYYWDNPGFAQGDNQPVVCISYNDVQNYIEWLNKQGETIFSLPTEAQWEYAARSGGKREKYAGGSDASRFAWHYNNANRKTHPVGTKQANNLGLYDMSGNVWEYCSDWYSHGFSTANPKRNPQGPLSGKNHVRRGGSWSENYSHVVFSDGSSAQIPGDPPPQPGHLIKFNEYKLVAGEWERNVVKKKASAVASWKERPGGRISIRAPNHETARWTHTGFRLILYDRNRE